MRLNWGEAISSDVMIIGGGGAGLRAAIAARLNGADVLLVSKSRVGRATNTYISKSVIAATGFGTTEDTPTLHVKDMIEGGRLLNDQHMAARIAGAAGEEINFLRTCGVRFGMAGESPSVVQIPGHRYPRHVYGENWIGSDLVLPLARRAVAEGVRFAEGVFVSRLIKQADRIVGAIGITAAGDVLAISAKAVLLATGGYAQIFLNTNNAAGITGDGQALAYDLGVPLKDMEFVQFYPTALGKRGSRILLYERLLAQPGVVLKNGEGANILRRNGISEPITVTRDQLARMIMTEIKEGRGIDGGVFMDLSELSRETADQMRQIIPDQWWKGEKTFKVAPTTHFCMGGVATNSDGESGVEGLYAVGEVAAGAHGANRLGGNALAEIFTMGAWAGKKAAERAASLEATGVSQSAAEKELVRLERFFSKQGSPAKQLIHELKRLMWQKAGIVRRESELRKVLARLNSPEENVAVGSPAELIHCLELRNMRLVSEAVCRAACERTESRGSHFRADYPEEDNQGWLVNILLSKGIDGMKISRKPVNLDGV